MSRRLAKPGAVVVAACLLLLTGFDSARSAAAQPAAGTHRVVGYLPSWSGSGPAVVTVEQASRLTHLTYAFAVVGGSHELVLPQARRVLGQLAALKRRHPHLVTMLAVGGAGSGSRPFSAMARTPEGRRRFAASSARMLYDLVPGALDGLTIDWEYPLGDGQGVPGHPGDWANHAALLQELRATLEARAPRGGRPAILATTLPGQVDRLAGFDLRTVDRLVDYADVMAFDYAAGAPRTGHNAPLYGRPPAAPSVDHTLQALRRAGMTPAKLNLGLPFYGRGWRDVKDGGSQGLGQAGRVTGAATYRSLAGSLASSHDRRHWDETGQVPFLFGGSTGAWISYDDARSIGHKARYARRAGLGGLFVWHLGADDRQGTLLQAAVTGLGSP